MSLSLGLKPANIVMISGMQCDLFFNGLENIIDDQGRVQYQSRFIDAAYANALIHEIQNALELKHETINIFGQSILQPRLTAWVADAGVEYAYSGLNSRPQAWTPLLRELKTRLEGYLKQSFNGVLCNYYRNGEDYMGWHSDDEKALGYQATIASISLGAERRFDLRKKSDKKIRSIHLQHGSLLIMQGCLQQYWQHRLPKQGRQSQDNTPRINLTFRSIQLQ